MILEVALSVGTGSLTEMRRFYVDRLGCTPIESESERLAVQLGETALRFAAVDGEPFYHFAFLVPGDRHDAAMFWARSHVDLLPADDGNRVFAFDFWDARACYFHDPAGNIVELVAHHGISHNGRSGPFSAREIVGISEIGIVGEPWDLAERLATNVGLELWDGVVGRPDRLAFVGQKARTLILASEGRPWLPTGRPAESHPVEVTVAGEPAGEVTLQSGGWVRRLGYLE